MKKIIVCILAIGCSVNAVAADLVEDIWCIMSSVEQYLPKDQPIEEKKVVKSELVAVREMVRSGDLYIYTVNGTYTDENGDVTSTYTSKRQTKRVDLSNSQYKEISTAEMKTIYSQTNPTPSERTYQLVATYEKQFDGTKKIIKMVQDGEVVDIEGTEFSIISRDGVEYNASLIDQPKDYRLNDGSIYRTELSKQFCTITKR